MKELSLPYGQGRQTCRLSRDRVVQVLGLTPAASLTEALALAEKIIGDPAAPLTVIPDAAALVIEE